MKAEHLELEVIELSDWLASEPMVVLVNAATTPHRPTKADIPDYMLDRLGGRRPDFLKLHPDQLWNHGIILSHDQLAQFRAGKPMLLAVGADRLPAPLKRGRREREQLEKEVQDALAIQVYLRTERICALLEKQHGSRWMRTVPAQRDEVLERLAIEAWVDDGKGKEDAAERSHSFYRTQYDAGSRLACSFYRGSSSPGELAKLVRRTAVVECDRRGGSRELAAEFVQQDIERIRFLTLCLRQATSLARAVHEIAGDVRAERPLTKAAVRTTGGAIPERPALPSVVLAAIDCDLNVAVIFRSLLSYSDVIEVARVLGRYERGEDIRLDPAQVSVLERQLEIALPYLERVTRTGDVSSEEVGAAVLIAGILLDAAPADAWRSMLREAMAGQGAITLRH